MLSVGVECCCLCCCTFLTLLLPIVRSNMADVDIATCNDEELLSKLLGSTDDGEKRKAIRNRLKQIREAEDKILEERRKQREAQGPLDSVKTRAQQAELERANKLKSYQEQAKTSIAASNYDPVKAKHERNVQDRAAEMKHFEELAKYGGPGALQGGLEKVKQMEQAFAHKQHENLIHQFDKLQTNYTKQAEFEAQATQEPPPKSKSPVPQSEAKVDYGMGGASYGK